MRGFLEKHLALLATGLVLVVLFSVAAGMFENFARPLVVANIFRNNAYLGVIAIGMTFVIISGGIDLSVGTLLGFTTIFVAKLLDAGTGAPVAIGLALLVGCVFGAGQGALIQVYKLPPFLVTLAGMFLAKGLAFVVHLQSLSIGDEGFRALAKVGFKIGKAPVPMGTLVFVGVFLVALVVAHRTRFGRNVYAVGGSESSAVLMGLPVGRTKVGVYALSGLFAALGGVVYAMGTSSGNPAIGLGMELDAIACAVIGGTLLTGGVGLVAGTLLGVLIYGTINEALRFQGTLDSSWLRISMGALLLVFIVFQRGIGKAGKLTR